jgi:hypothetical protein
MTNPGGFCGPVLGYPGGNWFPALNQGCPPPAPAFGLQQCPASSGADNATQQRNVSAQRAVGDWLVGASYLGNRSIHLWRATELNPAVFGPRDDRQHPQRRVLVLQNAAQGQFYGTIGQVDDTARQLQRGASFPAAAV